MQLKAYEDDAVIAGYVLCQDGKKWNKMWYQVKKDCVLYKFKAHEVCTCAYTRVDPLPIAVLYYDTLYRLTMSSHVGVLLWCWPFLLVVQDTDICTSNAGVCLAFLTCEISLAGDWHSIKCHLVDSAYPTSHAKML